MESPFLLVLPREHHKHMVYASWMPFKDVQELLRDHPTILTDCTYNPNAPLEFVREHNHRLYQSRCFHPHEWNVNVFLSPNGPDLEWIMNKYIALPCANNTNDLYYNVLDVFGLYRKIRRATATADIAWIDSYIDGIINMFPELLAHFKKYMCRKIKIINLGVATWLTYDKFIGLLSTEEYAFIRAYPDILLEMPEDFHGNLHIVHVAPLQALLDLGLPVRDLFYNRQITIEHVRACNNDVIQLNMSELSKNPSITWQTVKAHPDLPWDMSRFLINPSILLTDLDEIINGRLKHSHPYLIKNVHANTFTHYFAGCKIVRLIRAKFLLMMRARIFAAANRALTPRISCGYMKDIIAGFIY
jgi:hypothetical protein